MAIWESEEIKDVVTKIKNGKFVLPVIQRRLVRKHGRFINWSK